MRNWCGFYISLQFWDFWNIRRRKKPNADVLCNFKHEKKNNEEELLVSKKSKMRWDVPWNCCSGKNSGDNKETIVEIEGERIVMVEKCCSKEKRRARNWEEREIEERENNIPQHIISLEKNMHCGLKDFFE